MTDEITSRNNDKIKFATKLLISSRVRSESGLFAVEGLRLCVDAVKSGIKPVELFYTKESYEKHKNEIDLLINAADDIFLTDNKVFEKISDTVSPQGIMCILKKPQNIIEFKSDGKYIVLCNIADPSNLGAISRTAEALGVDGMIVSGGCDIYNSKALRASMGALFRIALMIAEPYDITELLKANKIKSYASTPRENATTLNSCIFDGGCAILIGNEANGLPDEIIENCDEAITIRMKGRAESLNAAAAAAILMYKMME